MLTLTIPRPALLAALDVCGSVVRDSNAANILSHVLIDGTGDDTVFRSTDYDTHAIVRVSAKAEKPGYVAVNAKALLDVVKNTQGAEVTMRGLENFWVELTVGNTNFRLAGLSHEDFPEASPSSGEIFTIPSALLAAAIEHVDDCVSEEESRPSLNGALWTVTREEGEVRIVMAATDGHRLAKTEVLGGDSGTVSNGTHERLVHHRTLATYARALAGPNDTAHVMLTKAGIVLTLGNVTLDSRAIDETFPDYRKVVPKTSQFVLNAPKAELLAAIRSVSPMVAAKTLAARMAVTDAGLVLSTQNPERGEARATIAADVQTGDAPEGWAIGVNVKYLAAAVGSLAGDRVWIGCVDQYSPIKITSPDDEGSLYVVMPMRI